MERDFWTHILERWVIESPMLGIELLGFVVALFYIRKARGAALCAAAGFAMAGMLELVNPLAYDLARRNIHSPFGMDVYFFSLSALNAFALALIALAVFIGRRNAAGVK